MTWSFSCSVVMSSATSQCPHHSCQKRLLLQLQCLQCCPARLSITVTKDSAFLWTTLIMNMCFGVLCQSSVQYRTGLDNHDFFCCPAVPAIWTIGVILKDADFVSCPWASTVYTQYNIYDSQIFVSDFSNAFFYVRALRDMSRYVAQ